MIRYQTDDEGVVSQPEYTLTKPSNGPNDRDHLMNSPTRIDPEAAKIGRPTPTAGRLVEASVSPNTRRAYAGELRRLDAGTNPLPRSMQRTATRRMVAGGAWAGSAPTAGSAPFVAA